MLPSPVAPGSKFSGHGAQGGVMWSGRPTEVVRTPSLPSIPVLLRLLPGDMASESLIPTHGPTAQPRGCLW